MSKAKTSKLQPTRTAASSKVAVPEDEVGKRIQQKRNEFGWSQSGLAERTKHADANGEGISRTVISGYETGEYKPGARELRILCETLKVSPNWLLYARETPFEVLQPSLEMTRVGAHEHEASVPMRLAFAMWALDRHERDALYSLVLSMAGRKLGDRKLSGLMLFASMINDGVVKELKAAYPDIFEGRSVSDALERVAEKMTEGIETGWGNRLKFDDDGNPIGGDELYRSE